MDLKFLFSNLASGINGIFPKYWKMPRILVFQTTEKFGARDGLVRAKRYGVNFSLNLSDYLHRKIFLYAYENREIRFIQSNVEVRSTALDIGANLGLYSFLLTQKSYGVQAHVYSFEPVPSSFLLLNENVRLNNFENNIKALMCGLGNKDFKAYFSNSDSKPGQLSSGNFHLSVDQLDGVTIHSKIEVEIFHPSKFFSDEVFFDFVKVDVEGMELEVLKGFQFWLDNSQIEMLMIEMNITRNGFTKDSHQVNSFLISKGYFPHRIDGFGRLRKITNVSTIFLKINNINLFYKKLN